MTRSRSSRSSMPTASPLPTGCARSSPRFPTRASARRPASAGRPRATTGWGTLARYVFLGLIYPQHFLYRIPWGGSFAIRRSAIESTGLLEHWTHCLGEDTSAYGPLRRAGLRLAFVPAATQVNSEATDLDGAHAFMLRQILSARLHHVFWPAILAANVATIVSFLISSPAALVGIVGIVLSIFGVATGLWKLTAFAIIPALYCVGLLLALAVGDLPGAPGGLRTAAAMGARRSSWPRRSLRRAPAMRCWPRRSCARSSGAASPMTSKAATASACDPMVPITRRERRRARSYSSTGHARRPWAQCRAVSPPP